jgi:hypothetical protein
MSDEGLSDRERVASKIPHEASKVLSSRSTHGECYENHKQIAEFWSTYLGVDIEPHEVAQMMVLVKVSRESLGSIERDHFTDQSGYSGIAWVCQAYEYIQEHGDLPKDVYEDMGESEAKLLVQMAEKESETPLMDDEDDNEEHDNPEPPSGDREAIDGMTERELLRRVARPLRGLTTDYIRVEGVRSMSGEEWDFDDQLEITLFDYEDVDTLGEAMREAEIDFLELSYPEEIYFDTGVAAHWPKGDVAGTKLSSKDPKDVHQFSAYSETKKVHERGPEYIEEEP